MKNNFWIEPLPQAFKDLDLIEEYYLSEFSEATAQKVRKSIIKSWQRLEMFPDSGLLTPNQKINDKGYRMVLSGKYASIYSRKGSTIYIRRIVSTNTNYQEIFEEK